MDITRPFCWIWRPERALGNVPRIKQLFPGGVAVKLNDSDTLHEPISTNKLLDELRSHQVLFALWGYCKPGQQLLNRTVRLLKEYIPDDCQHYIIDAESEWEGVPSYQASNFAHQVAQQRRTLGYPVNLHLSSFYAPNLHSTFPFQAFLSHCLSYMPQVYKEPNSAPLATTIDRTEKYALPFQKVTFGGLFLPTINDPQLVQPLHQASIQHFNVYLWDGDPATAMESDLGVQGHGQEWEKVLT